MKNNKQIEKREYQLCNCGMFFRINPRKVKSTRDAMHYYCICPRCKKQLYIDLNGRSIEFKEKIFRKKY